MGLGEPLSCGLVLAAPFFGVFLVVMAWVRRHDFQHEAVAFDLRNHIPEAEHAAQVAFTVKGLAAEAYIEVAGVKQALALCVVYFVALFFCMASVLGIPLTAGQFFGRCAQHAFDTNARQVGQAVGVEECKAVFQRVFVAQAGSKGGGGGGLQAQALEEHMLNQSELRFSASLPSERSRPVSAPPSNNHHRVF
jgi:hypothetical protein